MKKLISATLAASLALSLAACGSSASTDSVAASSEAASTSTAATAEAAGEGSGAYTGTPIKIGGIGPLTGSAAVYGIATKTGAQVAVDEINALGGLQFALDFQDDEGDAEKAVNAYNNLKGKGMQVLYGTTTTTPCVAVAAETFNDRIFQLTPSASSTDVTANKDNVFQVCFTDPNQGISSADYIFEHMPESKLAVIYRNDDAYSQGIRDTFVQEAADKGMEVVYQGTFTNDTASDFTVQLTGAQKAGADLVFMPIYYQPASIILAQAKQMGYAPTFFGVDGMDGILTMENFDASLAEGLMLLTPFSATVPETKSFVDAYTAAYTIEPNQFAADAYDGVYIVKEALEKAGCTADMSNSDICDALVAQLTSSDFSYSGLTGKDMTWNAEGQVSKAPTAYVIKDGEYVLPED